MKYILIILILCFCEFSYAQHSLNIKNKKFTEVYSNYNALPEKVGNRSIASFQIDTLKPLSFSQSCFVNPQNSLVIYAADYTIPHDSGFVSGNNVYGDIEKGQHYVNSNTLTISGCAILLNRAASSHSNSIGARVKLYSFNSQPSSLLAMSAIKPMDSLNNNGYTIFNFSSPVTVSTDFLVSLILPQNTGDTMAIYTTKVNCNSGSSLSWERAVDSTWGTIHINWNFSSTDNIDLAIFPLLQSINTSISDFKNPSDNFYFSNTDNLLRYSSSISKSHLAIYDMLGRSVVSKDIIGVNAMDLSFLTKGCYIIRVEQEGRATFKRIIIQ